eukprot:3425316-Rhodomonas_salina.1
MQRLGSLCHDPLSNPPIASLTRASLPPLRDRALKRQQETALEETLKTFEKSQLQNKHEQTLYQ